MIDSAEHLLEGVRSVLGAAVVFVVGWADESVARVAAASPARVPSSALPLPRSIIPDDDYCELHSPVPNDWLFASALRFAQEESRPGALLVCSAPSARGEDEPAALIALWSEDHQPGAGIDAVIDSWRGIFAGIVRGVLAAEAEAKSRAALEALFAAVPEGLVLTDEETGVAKVNVAAALLLDVAPGEIGANDLALAMRALHERSADPTRLEREGRELFQRSDGSRAGWIWDIAEPVVRTLRVTTLPVRASTHRGRLWTFEDITELASHRAALERALADLEQDRDRLWKAEQRYRLATRATRDVIWDLDLTTDALLWSDGLHEAFGILPASIATGHEFVSRIHTDDRARVTLLRQEVIREERDGWEDEFRLLRGDGTWATVRDRGTLVRDADGRLVRLIGALQDETQRTLLESQLRQVQKMEGIGRLAGGVAHDFNNLLTVMRGSIDFVKSEVPRDGMAAADLAEAQRAVDRATALTRQLLAFSRKQVLQPRPIDLHEIIRGVENLLRRVIGEDVHLETQLEATSCIVRADPGQIEQVLMNLAVNARDAMPDGGTLKVRTLSTLPREANADAVPLGAAAVFSLPHLLIAVSDTGSGMSLATIQSAFEPFFTTKDVSKGTGLGLSIVHGIITQSGGAVWLESSEGEGTTAWIALPLIESALQENGATSAPAVAPKVNTILVVEDEVSVRSLTVRMLRSAGYRVLGAGNGEEALKLWAANGGPAGAIDVVITDVVMPDMGGREFVRRLRESHADVPVLFMSGYAEGDLTTKSGGRVGFLEKPFDVNTLLEKIALLIATAPS